MRRLANEPEAFHQIAGSFPRFCRTGSAPAPLLSSTDNPDQEGGQEQEGGHEKQCGVRARSLCDPLCEETPGDTADNPGASQHRKQAFGFTCGPYKVSQCPNLSHHKNSANSDPHVEDRGESDPFVNMKAPPERDEIEGEEQ